MHHTLKCWPEAFDAVRSGAKTHEIRRDDRGYAVGDILLLHRYDPVSETYDPTAPVLAVRVTYKTPGGEWGLSADLCVLSITLIPEPSCIDVS